MTNSYDLVTYQSLPRRETHVAKLATIASLYGVEVAPPECCRILELGCGAGGNLLPMAVQYPQSELVGLDLAGSAIEEGNAIIGELDLSNIRLENRPIAFRKDLGEFDYIICHGVFSWVAKDIRERIFRICEKQLSRRGLAYISFNALPGWRLKGVLRDMMLYHVRGIEDPRERLDQAKAVLQFVMSGCSAQDHYKEIVRSGLKEIEALPRYYVFHEYLEEQNEAFYFQDFIEIAGKYGLDYVADAQLALSAVSTLPGDTREAMRSLGQERVRIEQYLDFIRNRTLREVILSKSGRLVEYPPYASRLRSMYLSFPPRNPEEEQHMRSGPETEDVRSSIGGELTKACLGILRDTWPARLAFNELEKIAREKVGKPGGSGNELCESLFACLEANLIEADLQDAAYTAYVPERPHTTALARLQALRHDSPTSLRHQAVRLESISRQVLALCNGERDREAILAELLVMAQRGELRIEERHGTVMNAAVIRSTLEPVLDRVLRQLSQHAFFKR